MQTDGNRISKDLRNYLNAIRGQTALTHRLEASEDLKVDTFNFYFYFFTDMREASRRLSQSLFDVYETGWEGEEDLGAIVEVS